MFFTRSDRSRRSKRHNLTREAKLTALREIERAEQCGRRGHNSRRRRTRERNLTRERGAAAAVSAAVAAAAIRETMARALRSSILAALGFSRRRRSTSSHCGESSCFVSKKDLHLLGYTAEEAGSEEGACGISGVPISGEGGGRVGWDLLGAKEYLDYRRSLYGEITHKALLVDAVGTLLIPSQPMAQIYRQFGEKYGVQLSEDEILNRYRWAYEQPWGRSRLRYVDDGRPFWQFIVTSSTGCSDSQYFEELYEYYTTEKAWHLCDPDAEKVFKAIREAGVKIAVVSNFDTRLRPLLRALKCDHWFDAVAVSAEVAAEKPNPTIFLKACELLGVKPEDAVHVGDDRRNDIWGARDAGCDAWLWGSDVYSFKEIAERIGVGIQGVA